MTRSNACGRCRVWKRRRWRRAFRSTFLSNPQNVLVRGVHGPDDRGTSVDTVDVSADYFDTLGVPLLRGRSFTTADTRESPHVAVVSEAMALRFWPAGTAVGQRFRLSEWGGQEYQVVGVSANYEVNSPGEDAAPYLHLAASQGLLVRGVLLARTGGDAAALSADIRRELRRIEPDVFFPRQGDTLREDGRRQYASDSNRGIRG